MANKKALSPKKYIKEKARNLPFLDCKISPEWNETGLANILISKTMPSGNIIVAFYLVDLMCLGVKDTAYRFNLLKAEYEHEQERLTNGLEDCDLATAHNIIYGSIDFAEECGFSPAADFSVTEYFLDPDLIDDGIDEIEFGDEGVPSFFAGPNDDKGKINRILSTLRKNVGEGNFEYTYQE